MLIPFPLSVILWLGIGLYWPVSLIAIGLLAAAAIRWGGWKRALSTVLATILGLCLVSYAVFVVSDRAAKRAQEAQESATAKRLTMTLAQDTQIPADEDAKQDESGILPAGSTVRWSSDARNGFDWADLHTPAHFNGAWWQGHLAYDAQGYWSGTLASDQAFGRWLCKGGEEALLAAKTRLIGCTLARDYRSGGQVFPAGLNLTLDYSSDIGFTVPEGRTLHLSETGITLAPHQVVHAFASGRIGAVTLNPFDELQPDPAVSFRGISVHGQFAYVHEGQDAGKPVTGIAFELREALNCGGRAVAVGTQLIVPLTGSSVILDSGEERGQALTGCPLQPVSLAGR